MKKIQWFVYDYYCAAGRPKAEEAVMHYAQERYLHCLVEDYMLEDIQMDLERYCMQVREENKRLAPVKITVTDERNRADGHARIYIGAQSLSLRRVKRTIE